MCPEGSYISTPGFCVIRQTWCNLLLHFNFQRVVTEVVAGAQFIEL